MTPGQDDPGSIKGRRGTQDRADILRVGYAIEHQSDDRLPGRAGDSIEAVPGQGIDQKGEALVNSAFRQPGIDGRGGGYRYRDRRRVQFAGGRVCRQQPAAPAPGIGERRGDRMAAPQPVSRCRGPFALADPGAATRLAGDTVSGRVVVLAFHDAGSI